MSSDAKNLKADTSEQDKERPPAASGGKEIQDSLDKEAVTRRAMWGLFVRKPRWSLSWRGWLAGLLLVTCVGIFVFFKGKDKNSRPFPRVILMTVGIREGGALVLRKL